METSCCRLYLASRIYPTGRKIGPDHSSDTKFNAAGRQPNECYFQQTTGRLPCRDKLQCIAYRIGHVCWGVSWIQKVLIDRTWTRCLRWPNANSYMWMKAWYNASILLHENGFVIALWMTLVLAILVFSYLHDLHIDYIKIDHSFVWAS